MPDEYDKPGVPGSKIDYQRLIGHLLLIKPSGYEQAVNTANGVRDAVRATIAVVETGEVIESTLVFPQVMVGQLRDRIGGKVLGRLTQGAAKPGQSPPWIIAEATEGDIQQARAFEQRMAASGYQAPAQPSPALADARQQGPQQPQYPQQGQQPPYPQQGPQGYPNPPYPAQGPQGQPPLPQGPPPAQGPPQPSYPQPQGQPQAQRPW
jgi:hypothetical protein